MDGARPSLLIVEDDPSLAGQLDWALRDDYRIETAGRREAALAALARGGHDLALLDLCLPPGNTPEEGLRILDAARERDVTAIVMSAVGERGPALEAIERGAFDFFVKPVDLAALRVVLARAAERRQLERENRSLRRQLADGVRVEGIVGASAAMRDVHDAVRRVADTSLTVTLLGESGTGKSLAARAIHATSSRRAAPFVAVHCSAIPETLLEAELFGHERGAFTGAVGARPGRFEAASGGTLFLDEIGCLSTAIQIKLLRVLEDRQVERLGSPKSRTLDLRLVVATNEDLSGKVRRGEMREDFYFRIMGFPIRLPSLRERPEDIPRLAEHFLARIADEQGVPQKRLTEAARLELLARPWPGNVRELRHLVETAAVVVDGPILDAEHLRRLPSLERRPASASAPPVGPVTDFRAAVEAYERAVLKDAIEAANGVKAEAARRLGLDLGQMKYLARKYRL